MDSEEIAKRVGSLKLSTDKEADKIIISADLTSEGLQKLESCLVGKVFSSKAVNRETFRVQMPRILQAKQMVKIEVIGDNLFLLDFHSLIDRRRALCDGPWSFFKDLVIFKAPVGLQKPTDLTFDEVPIWVQCHNAPLAFMIAPIINNIGARIGRVMEVETGEDGRCKGKFARIRIALDISKPLKKGVWVQPENGKDDICILLLYERLPNFCYGCGKLGHVSRDCAENDVVGSEQPYGNWLRASSVAGYRKESLFPSNSSNSSGSTNAPSRDNGANTIVQPVQSLIPLARRENLDESEDRVTAVEIVSDRDANLPVTSKENMESTEENIVKLGQKSCTIEQESVSQGIPKKKKWKRLARGSPIQTEVTSVGCGDKSPNK